MKNHTVTKKTYPKGFELQLEFRFDPNQKPRLPKGAENEEKHKHRPTFLGNSGVGIYWWPRPKDPSTQLYEIQITDTSRMCKPGTRFLYQENGFSRLDYGANYNKVIHKKLSNEAVVMNDRKHLDPREATLFRNELKSGGADNLCALIAGVPPSYFQDVYLSEKILKDGGDLDDTDDFKQEIFPAEGMATTSAVGTKGDKKFIGGLENPLRMYYKHRADNVPKAGVEFTHFNKDGSGEWNTLKVCFLPAEYDENGTKIQNAFIRSEVNGKLAFGHEVKTGTRTARHILNIQDPEKDVYVQEKGDKKIRLLGHWGSKVEYQKVKIKSKAEEQ